MFILISITIILESLSSWFLQQYWEDRNAYTHWFICLFVIDIVSFWFIGLLLLLYDFHLLYLQPRFYLIILLLVFVFFFHINFLHIPFPSSLSMQQLPMGSANESKNMWQQ